MPRVFAALLSHGLVVAGRLALVCDDTIWIVTADGSSRRRLSRPADGLVGVPSWSPNGSWIAYGHRCYETEMHGGDVFCDVAVARPDGTARRAVVRRNGLHGPSSSPPVWSSEGNLLVAEWGYGSDILLVDPRSGVRRKVCSTAGWNLTAGRSGTFAFVDGTLDIFDARGRRLLRRSLPETFGDDLSIWLGR